MSIWINLLNRATHTGQQALATISDAGTAASKDTGTANGEIPELEDVSGSPGLPAVDGSQLTNLSSGGAHVIGSHTDTNLGTPGAGEDTWVIGWDDGASEYVLQEMTGGSGGSEITGDLPGVQARRTTTYSLAPTWSDVPFDTTDIENASAYVEHTASDQITLHDIGMYMIQYQFQVNASVDADNTNIAQGRIRIDDTTVIDGSLAMSTVHSDTSVPGELTHFVSGHVLYDCQVADETVSLQAQQNPSYGTGASPVVDAGAVLQVLRLGVGTGNTAAGMGQWQYSSSTTAADPGAGYFRLDAAPASAVALYLSDLNKGGADVSTLVNSLWKANDFIYLQDPADSTNAHMYKITAVSDQTGWFNVTIEFQDSGSGSIAADDYMALVYFAAGSAGTAAWGGITGTLSAQTDLQGELDDKLNLGGGALTGAVTTNSTFDGRTVSTDGSTLDTLDGANTEDVTLLGAPNYITISGQAITRNTIVATTDLSATGTKDSTTYLRGDDIWAAPAGSGDVTAAVVLTDHELVRADGGAKGVQDSPGSTLSDAGNLVVSNDITAGNDLYVSNALDVTDDATIGGQLGTNSATAPTAGQGITTVGDIDIEDGNLTFSGVSGGLVDGVDVSTAVLSPGTTEQDAALFTERADHVNTPVATKAELWVSNDTTQKLMFTDDAGTDTDLTGAGGAATDLATTGADVAIDGSIPTQQGQILVTTSATTAAWTEEPWKRPSQLIRTPAANEEFRWFKCIHPIHVTGVDASLMGSATPSVDFTIYHADKRDGSGIAPTEVHTVNGMTSTAGTGLVYPSGDDSIPAGSYVWTTIDAVSGTVDLFELTMQYTEDYVTPS